MGHSMGGLAVMEFTKRYDEPEIQEMMDRVIIVDIPAESVSSQESGRSTGDMLKRML
jgi:pimeloyl-ACP methyl ester carboxylesterase